MATISCGSLRFLATQPRPPPTTNIAGIRPASVFERLEQTYPPRECLAVTPETLSGTESWLDHNAAGLTKNYVRRSRSPQYRPACATAFAGFAGLPKLQSCPSKRAIRSSSSSRRSVSPKLLASENFRHLTHRLSLHSFRQLIEMQRPCSFDLLLQ